MRLGEQKRRKKELSKDISAFANSAGGTIVYGIIEANHLPTKLDIGYLPSEITKEWVEQVISGNIQRRIDGLRINPVRLAGCEGGRVAHVISIPQSTRAPHMAADHRFYKRFNFESAPMEEYEVRDVAHRSETPDLRLDIQWQHAALPTPVLELYCSIANDAPDPATHVVVRLYVDAGLTILDSHGLGGPVATRLGAEEGEVAVGMLSLNWNTPARVPIWEGEPFRLTDGPIRLGLPPGHGKYVFGWCLSAPRMTPKRRFFTILYAGDLRIVERP